MKVIIIRFCWLPIRKVGNKGSVIKARAITITKNGNRYIVFIAAPLNKGNRDLN